jgi:hypothetical protein
MTEQSLIMDILIPTVLGGLAGGGIMFFVALYVSSLYD